MNALYQKSLINIISAKVGKKSLATVEDAIFETCRQRTKHINEKGGGVNLKDLEDSSDESEDKEDDEDSGEEKMDENDEEVISDIEVAIRRTRCTPKLNSVPYPGEYEAETNDKKTEREEKARS